VIVRVVWNSNIRLYNASNVRVTIDSRFDLSTTPNPTVFYPPELCYRATRSVQFRKRTDFCDALLQHISKFISLFEETPPAELNEYRARRLHRNKSLQLPRYLLTAASLDISEAEIS